MLREYNFFTIGCLKNTTDNRAISLTWLTIIWKTDEKSSSKGAWLHADMAKKESKIIQGRCVVKNVCSKGCM